MLCATTGRATVTLIKLDATTWREPADFYDAILRALGSPAWHGRNPLALMDTMISGAGAVHDLKPTYRVEILNSAQLAPTVRDHIVEVIGLFGRVRGYRRNRGAPDVDATILMID
jgi:Barstar (barnase inhibitor)